MATNEEHRAAIAKLIEKYPAYFDNTNTHTRTQIELPPGWLGIFTNLCERIDDHLKTNESESEFKWIQVKEKFATLSAYFRYDGDYPSTLLLDMVGEATAESSKTCKICGDPGKLANPKGSWLMTLCEKHNHKDVQWFEDDI